MRMDPDLCHSVPLNDRQGCLHWSFHHHLNQVPFWPNVDVFFCLTLSRPAGWYYWYNLFCNHVCKSTNFPQHSQGLNLALSRIVLLEIDSVFYPLWRCRPQQENVIHRDQWHFLSTSGSIQHKRHLRLPHFANLFFTTTIQYTRLAPILDWSLSSLRRLLLLCNWSTRFIDWRSNRTIHTFFFKTIFHTFSNSTQFIQSNPIKFKNIVEKKKKWQKWQDDR